jgi:hypothetical protein
VCRQLESITRPKKSTWPSLKVASNSNLGIATSPSLFSSESEMAAMAAMAASDSRVGRPQRRRTTLRREHEDHREFFLAVGHLKSLVSVFIDESEGLRLVQELRADLTSRRVEVTGDGQPSFDGPEVFA